MDQSANKGFQKRKKLNLNVKQNLQVWLLIRIMGTVIMTIGVASIILYYYSVSVVDADYLSFSPTVRKVSEVLLPVLLAASLTSIIAGLLLALFLPQKIAGPIYRIEQDLLEIRTGNLVKSITLRSDDILKDLANSLNMSVHDIRNLIHDVKEANSDLETKITNGDLTEIRQALEHQKQCLERIKT